MGLTFHSNSKYFTFFFRPNAPKPHTTAVSSATLCLHYTIWLQFLKSFAELFQKRPSPPYKFRQIFSENTLNNTGKYGILIP